MTTLFGSVSNQLGMTFIGNNGSLTDARQSIIKAYYNSFTNGTATGQADLIYTDRISLASASTSTFNLTDGSLEDPEGNSLIFVNVKAINITHLATSFSSDIQPGGSFIVSNFLSQAAKTPSGSMQEMDDPGYSVGVNNLLTVDNNDASNPASYEITIIGTSA